MGYSVSFSSCWAKLDRAKVHRDSLENRIHEMFAIEANRPTLRAKLDEGSGYHVYRIKTVPNLDPILSEIGLSVGDTVQNIRHALDHLTWQLACSFTNGAVVHDKRVQFPIVTERFSDDGTDLWEQARKRNLSEIDPAHCSRIELYQPYRGPSGRADSWSGEYIHQLALLQDLSNTDKHRVLTSVLLVPNQFNPVYPAGARPARRSLAEWASEHGMAIGEEIQRSDVEDIGFASAGNLVRQDVEVCRIRFEGSDVPDEVEMAGRVTPHVALSEGRPAVATLDRMATFAALIITEFESLFSDPTAAETSPSG